MNRKWLKIFVDVWWYFWEAGIYILINPHVPEVGLEFLISPSEATSEISTEILLLICGNKWCDSFQCEMDVEKWVRGICYFFFFLFLFFLFSFCREVSHMYAPKIGEIGFSLRMGWIPTSRHLYSAVQALCSHPKEMQPVEAELVLLGGSVRLSSTTF